MIAANFAIGHLLKKQMKITYVIIEFTLFNVKCLSYVISVYKQPVDPIPFRGSETK